MTNYLIQYQKQLGLKPDGIIGAKTTAAMMADLGITDKLFFAHLMGQMSHESDGFTRGRENLNYSANGLVDTWPNRFRHRKPGESLTLKQGSDGKAIAEYYHRQPEKIANCVYANRLGNGDEASGDGWKYRGIFGLQLTGKDNITEFMKSIGVSPNTDPNTLLDDPRNYFLAGKFWFIKNGVDKLCVNTTETCVKNVSRRINGGTIGLNDRIVKTKVMFSILGLA